MKYDSHVVNKTIAVYYEWFVYTLNEKYITRVIYCSVFNNYNWANVENNAAFYDNIWYQNE